MRLFRKFLGDESGASVVELGLLAPILSGLLIGVVDLGKGFSEKLVLEQVAQRAIEKAMQGVQVDSQSSIFATLKSEAATEAGVQNSAVVVKYWLECNGTSTFVDFASMDTKYNDDCPAGQRYARFIEVKIEKAYTPTFAMPWLNTNSAGKVLVKARAGTRVQ
ncbi:Flp pilus assembly protein TadG [Sphingomonas kaistensis]|uniref:Flp pilus assembly protein TadG n=1 Tax=Sphingomonas kaistensis TaxID=298708 RepID=A0A7X6BHF5_9SPHN|nr:TadE/TadG family type IV pilus assembly protein [Sphingomonas kaistensis]NJC06908.1 Flp pilus assembly protein TadG [Sphingomonas kaistensis]